MDPEVIEALRKRNEHVHPLIFQRSVERAKSAGELFDILDKIPNRFPIIWSEKDRKWVYTRDLVQSSQFNLNMERK